MCVCGCVFAGVCVYTQCVHIYILLVTYCYVTNHPKIQWLKMTTNADYFLVSMGNYDQYTSVGATAVFLDLQVVPLRHDPVPSDPDGSAWI